LHALSGWCDHLDLWHRLPAAARGADERPALSQAVLRRGPAHEGRVADVPLCQAMGELSGAARARDHQDPHQGARRSARGQASGRAHPEGGRPAGQRAAAEMMEATALDAATARSRTRASRRWRGAAVGHLCTPPGIRLTGLFVYWPLVASTVLSFYDWNLVSPTW